jgi:hypothetical protein
MRKAVVPAIILLSFAYPHHSALSWEWNSLGYQEAVWMCSNGNLQACEAMYVYEMARSGRTMSASRHNGAAPTTPE